MMNMNHRTKINQAIISILAIWGANYALAKDTVKIDRFPPVTGGGEFATDVATSGIKPNVFVVLDNSGSMQDKTHTTSLTLNGVPVNFPGTRATKMQVVSTGILNGFKRLEGKVRLGYMSINDPFFAPTSGRNSEYKKYNIGPYLNKGSGINYPSNTNQYNLVPRDFVGAYAGQFYDWVAYITPSGGTPLVEAASKVLTSVINNQNGPNAATAPSGAALDFFANAESDTKSKDYGYPAVNPTKNNIQSCRANFEIMIADGGYNGAVTSVNGINGEVIEDKFSHEEIQLPESSVWNGKTITEYAPKKNISNEREYGYNYTDTYTWPGGLQNYVRLSDVAFYGWVKDLRPDLTNNVVPYWHETDKDGNPVERLRRGAGSPPIIPFWDRKNDPATWQHITFFAVGLTDGGIESWEDYSAYNALYADLKGKDTIEGYFREVEARNIIPPVNTGGTREYKNEEDFAKSAKMGRGEALSANTAESFEQVIDRIVDRIETAYLATKPLKSTISGSISTNSITSTQKTSSMLYTAYVDVEGHIGDVLGYKLCDSTTASISCVDGVPKDPSWHAADLLYKKLANNNNTGYKDIPVYTIGEKDQRVDFKWDNLSDDQKSALRAGKDEKVGADRVDYVRGKFVRSDAQTEGDLSTQKVSQDTLDPKEFRPRGKKDGAAKGDPVMMGEIVYSQPKFVDNRGTLSTFHPLRNSPSYKTFLTNSVEGKFQKDGKQVGAREELVIFGSNDGKVYAINGETGETVFQYVPLGAYEKLAETTKPGFTGDTLVAGEFEVKDVQFADGSWHTLAVGSMGAGGQSVFAFDLNKENLNDPEKLILWEQTASSQLGKTLGNVMAKPRIVWLADTTTANTQDGKWVVLVPNGYNSAGNSASLIVLDAESGNILAEVDTKAVAPNGEGNGLGPLTVQDTDYDGGADFVYAGDLQGNVWKFDLSGWKDNKIGMAYDSRNLQPYYDARDEYIKAKTELKADPKNNSLVQKVAKKLQEMDDAYNAIPQAKPLFVAEKDGKRQPITSGIGIADSADGEGVMMYFGTGELFSTDSAGTPSPQSFYAVNDNYRIITKGQGKGDSLPLKRENLFPKELFDVTNVNIDNNAEREKIKKAYNGIRGVRDQKGSFANTDGSQSEFGLQSYAGFDLNGNKDGSGDYFGWLVDFPPESYTAYDSNGTAKQEVNYMERVINQPIILDDQLFFLSFSPRQGGQVRKTVDCEGTTVDLVGGESGIARFYMLDRLTGGYLENSPFDLTGDGKNDGNDLVTVGQDTKTGDPVLANAASLAIPGGYATLAGGLAAIKNIDKGYGNQNNSGYKSDNLLCETERQIIFPSAKDADGNTLVLKGCYENRFRTWKQIQQEF